VPSYEKKICYRKMESHTINLGTYNLFNVNINLVLNIIFKGNQVVRAIIPLPQNYPLTQSGISDMVKSRGLFEAEINIITNKSISWYYYPMDYCTTIVHRDVKRALVINKFYNIPKFENLEITDKENMIFNGLGRRLLCITFPYIVKYFNIDPKKTPIVLQASGGAIRNQNDRDRSLEYLKLGRLGILQVYQNKYPEDFESSKILFNEYSDQELAEALVSLENNEKLIGYYNTIFGFQQLDYISMETKMATSLNTFLSNCADPVKK
jgi:hypothetical protein